MRVAFVLPGLHRVCRGAEAAFESVARELAKLDDMTVTLIGGGQPGNSDEYRFIHAGLCPRERFRKWPSIPPLRSEYRYEELTFATQLWRVYDPTKYDVTLTCSYPFVQWVLRTKRRKGKRPLQVFVTENGDWPARRTNAEYRLFDCDGLVCTNPDYFQRHSNCFESALIPNGIDASRYCPGDDERLSLGLPVARPLFLMVSALIQSKYPLNGVRAVAAIPGAALVVAGDGPLREACDQLGRDVLGDRYRRLTLPSEQMPSLYRSADVLLHMSRSEAFGNIYIEAAACGLPVVAHDYETPRWILGNGGFFVDTQCQESLVKLLREVTGKLKGNMPLSHRELADRFDWKVVAAQYANFLRDLYAKKGASNE